VLIAAVTDRGGATSTERVTVEVRSRMLTFSAIADTSVLSGIVAGLAARTS
jgi:hypothetical protein